MVSIATYVFKTADNLDLKLDIYTRESWSQDKAWNEDQPVALYFHGGGFVGYDRAHVPQHIVQSSLLRGWPLVSADYRKLPQVNGEAILSDVKAAYDFVVEKLLGILTQGRSTSSLKNIIALGGSAGGNLALLCGHYMTPRPLAVLSYYAPGTVQLNHFRTGKVLGEAPLQLSQVEQFISEPVSLGVTHPSAAFHQQSLLPDLSRNPDFQPMERVPGLYPRMKLFPWLVQQNLLPELMGDVDKGLEDEAWKTFPPLILLYGSKDHSALIETSRKLAEITGGTLFIAEGQGHAFDMPLYLGNPILKEVEAAWAALDEIVNAAKSGERPA